MSEAVFWGLSKVDFRNATINGFYISATFAIGMTVAASVTYLALRIIADPANKTIKTRALCGAAGAVIGIGASFYATQHLTPITFVAEKSLKFLVLTFPAALTGVLSFVTTGGMWGYFGRKSLYFAGLMGGLSGGMYAGGLTDIISRGKRK
jgi:hypothetical protein